MDFLTELFDEQFSYSAVNTARSMLSNFLVCNGKFGIDPTVCQFMKGAYNLRPPKARYHEIWDANIVIKYLRGLSPVNMLNFTQLTLKVVMLMALISAQRVGTLHSLTVDMLRKTSNSFVFHLDAPLKQSRDGKPLPYLEFKAYPRDRRLCIFTYLKEFLKRRKLKVGNVHNKLFISLIGKHKPVSKSTIARWIKIVLKNAGINTNIFKAHSVRAASVSKAKEQDIPIEDIMSNAGWTNSSTFGKFYDKPIRKQSFAEAVLKL